MGLITRNFSELKEAGRRSTAEGRPTTQPVRTDTRGGGGGAQAPGFVFPVLLTPSGGFNGTATTQAGFRYHVFSLSGTQLLTNQNPTSLPHMWRRPSVGWMAQATFGLAYIDPNTEQVILTWVNEVIGQEACN